jgi:membrane dipeptidase
MASHDPPPRIAELLRRYPPIDLHADTPSLMRVGYDFLKRHRPPLPRAALGIHLDLPRLQEGGYGGVFFGLVTSPIRLGDRVASVERQLAVVERTAERSGGKLVAALRPGAFREAPARGAVAYAFGLEGAHALEGRLDPLESWARRGLRYLTVVHFSRRSGDEARRRPDAVG